MPSFHSFLSRLMLRLPFQVKRRGDDELPEAKLDNIQLVLAYFIATKGNPTFVQVGACDGVSGDPAHSFVKRGEMISVLVEPIERSFEKLKNAYQGVQNVSLIRAAIAERDGEVSIYSAKQGSTSIDEY